MNQIGLFFFPKSILEKKNQQQFQSHFSTRYIDCSLRHKNHDYTRNDVVNVFDIVVRNVNVLHSWVTFFYKAPNSYVNLYKQTKDAFFKYAYLCLNFFHTIYENRVNKGECGYNQSVTCIVKESTISSYKTCYYFGVLFIEFLVFNKSIDKNPSNQN